MTYPRWIDERADFNLREVAPGLFVGAERAVELRPAGPWRLVADFYGSSAQKRHARRYAGVHRLVQWPFLDGDTFPAGLLDGVWDTFREERRKGPVLLHCQAGLSRSASAAYALLRRAGLGHQAALDRVHVEDGFPVPSTLASARRWAEQR